MREVAVLRLGAVMWGWLGGAQAQKGGWRLSGRSILQRGVNLSSFYAQTRDLAQARLDAYMSVADMQALKAMGFDHVRLSINPALLIANPKTGALREGPMAQLDKTVAQLTGSGLNVILDIHAEEDWKAGLIHGDDGAQSLFAFWEQFGGHYAKSDPERVFFEILNEPSMDDLYRWEGIQDRAVAAIRSVAPRHTIIATAAAWGHQDGLLAMEPVRDDDVIYTFHDYDPMWFTHQGATWSTAAWAFLHGVPYPSTPENIRAGAERRAGASGSGCCWSDMARTAGDPSAYEAEIAAVAQWAEERKVPLYCGEFGVFKDHTTRRCGRRGSSDTRTALERHHIGWAMWDYDGNFGLAVKGSDGIVVDPDVLRALGMR